MTEAEKKYFDDKYGDKPQQAKITPKHRMELFEALNKDYQNPNVPIPPIIKNWLSNFYGEVWQNNYGVGTKDKDKKPFTEDWTAMTEGISGIDWEGNIPFSMGIKTTKEDVEDDVVGKTGVPKDIRYKSKAEVHFHPSEYLRDGKVMISGHQNPSDMDKEFVNQTNASNHFVLGEDGRLYAYNGFETMGTEQYIDGEYYYGETLPRPDRLIRNFLTADDIKKIKSETRLPAKAMKKWLAEKEKNKKELIELLKPKSTKKNDI